MTGFGAAQHEADGWAAGVEIRTVNNRGLKLSARLSPNDSALEASIDKAIRQHIRRGTVQLTVQLTRTEASAASVLNHDLLQAYLESSKQAAHELGLDPPGTIVELLSLPGVADSSTDVEVDDNARAVALAAVQAAATSLNDFRATEGEAMRLDLEKLTAEIRSHLSEVTTRAPGVVEEYRDRLNERVAELLRDSEASVPHETIIREVSVFAERADINEEITRLDAHLDQFLEQINSGSCEGRKLDFLGQEMFREINTIGSKANDLTISRHVVEMKSAAEKIREMVQNVE